ncbi:hypothetical protein E4K08_00675 (plasmid) [Raoultella ornithinolytica]|nr:hypothetical protein AGH21_02010 [Klebsiella oxytoca]MBX4827955.1 hypothetical protein [Klebsiella grimontii]MTF12778.1 hypothetical protein [Raoultella ornithinolytica]OWY84567.1 hypothetical protein CAC00_28930 [Raoultella ornithinolytica]QCK75368.1 hypothetical protein E4K08_00675 [Raoultella ornithinolytica]
MKKAAAPAALNNTGCATRRRYYSGAALSHQYSLFIPVTSHPAFCCLSLPVFISGERLNKY